MIFAQLTRCLLLTAILLPAELPAAEPAMHELIDQHIEATLTKRKLPKADSASDAEFLRRVYLDLTGVIPDAKTAREFLDDSDKAKREKLIDRLLASEAFARHMAIVLDVTLMERRPDKYVTTPEWRGWLQASVAENKPLDQLVREILGSDGVDEKLRPAAKFYLDRAVEKDVLVRDIGRLFLGVDLQCAQCHDHPDIDDYLHRHYHGLSVFVAGSKTFRQPDGKFVLQETVLREVEFASVFEPDKTNKTGPRLIEALLEVPEFPEGEEYVEKPSRTVRSVPKFSLRKLLSERLPADETPEFARNLANRLWAMMMGRGIVHPLDAHHSSNPPSHPKLLDALSRRLVDSKYDLRVLLRELALSQTYQRSSLVPDGVDPNELPEDSFAVATMNGLSPEQLFESLLTATSAEAILEKQIDEVLAEEAAESETKEENPDEPDEQKIAEARQKKRDEMLAEFVKVFGSVPGQPQAEFSASLPQALFLANNETVADWVPAGSSNLAAQLTALDDPKRIADELFLAVLSRRPDDVERQTIVEILKEASGTIGRESSRLWSGPGLPQQSFG